MPNSFIGTTFSRDSQWYQDEIDLIASIRQQIDQRWPDQHTLLINTTWFGPQFDNGQWEKWLSFRDQHGRIDRIVLLAAVDPVFIDDGVIAKIGEFADELILAGHFDSSCAFNFHSWVIPKFFETYSEQDLQPQSWHWRFISYNRKPRKHRLELVQSMLARDLDRYGVITFGKDITGGYEQSEIFRTLGERQEDYIRKGHWPKMAGDFGIPMDLHSLGDLSIWQNHFLTVVNETESSDDWPTLITEKTWKPIIGLRPFVVNGQSKVYSWLNQHGFRTFEWMWPGLDGPDRQQAIMDLCQDLAQKTDRELEQLWDRMLPDLKHNQQRFQQFGPEQFNRSRNLWPD